MSNVKITCTIEVDPETYRDHPDLVLRRHFRQLVKDYLPKFEYASYVDRILIDETTPKVPGFMEAVQQKAEELS